MNELINVIRKVPSNVMA